MQKRKKHGYAECLKYMQMIKEGTSIHAIHMKYGINEDRLHVLWNRYQSDGRSGLFKRKNIYIKNDDGVILGFEPVPFSDVNALFPNRQYEALYPFLSANSHPSFLGVLQFGQMYNAKQDKETTSLFAQTACICAAKMTKDVCSVITGGSEIKMGMSANESEAINMFGDL